jgi:hypothetical protein
MVLKKKVWFLLIFLHFGFPILFTWYLLWHSNLSRENVDSVVNIVMSEFKPRLLFCWVSQLNKCLLSF